VIVRSALSAALAVTCSASLTCAVRARADDAPAPAARALEDTRGPLFHPDGPGRYRWRIAGGALVDILPTRVVENQMRQVPMLTGNVRLGLPAGFSADMRLAAIVITNSLELGAAWTGHVSDLAISVHNHLGIWYGFLGVSGFDATGYGTLDTPGISLGLPWKRTRFTLTVELIATLGQHTKLGDAKTLARSRVALAGTSALLTIESFLPNSSAIYYGLGVIRAVPNYQAWVGFSDSRARLPYPRFVAGYEF
jgi:hypothetical protein